MSELPNGGQAAKPADAPNPFEERMKAEGQAQSPPEPEGMKTPPPTQAEPKKTNPLDSLVTTKKRRRPIFGVLYGPPGVGKSTFGTQLPKPVFIPTERIDQLTVAKLPLAESWAEFNEHLSLVENHSENYASIIIDSLDALELLIQEQVRVEQGVAAFEDLNQWGKGTNLVKDKWRQTLGRLTKLSTKKHVLLIGHSHIRTVTDPALPVPYDQHELRLPPKSGDIIKQHVDLLLFARIRTDIAKDKPKDRKGRGIVSEDRELYTVPTTGIEAKNRYDLTSPLAFTWEALATGVKAFYDK